MSTPPITDPHHVLAHLALGDRWRHTAFSALPDAPVLPVREPGLSRLRRLVARAAPERARRPVRSVRHGTVTASCG